MGLRGFGVGKILRAQIWGSNRLQILEILMGLILGVEVVDSFGIGAQLWGLKGAALWGCWGVGFGELRLKCEV